MLDLTANLDIIGLNALAGGAVLTTDFVVSSLRKKKVEKATGVPFETIQAKSIIAAASVNDIVQNLVDELESEEENAEVEVEKVSGEVVDSEEVKIPTFTTVDQTKHIQPQK